jgi:hypothetical protein
VKRVYTDGPTAWGNWRAADEGAPALGAYEAALYTDAHVTGQVRDGLGPYQLLNPIDTTRLYGRRGLSVGVVLRVEQHLDPPMPTPEDMSRTSTAHYLGGASTSDQIACLLALALGVRFRSGGETRTFALDDPDPRGRPLYATHRTPALAPPDRHSVIPAASGRTVLLDDAISMLTLLPTLEPDAATQVLRSARLYRQALWIADEDAELAWLLLVSALEVGATHWAAGRDTPAARLQHALPDLADVLRSAGGDRLVEQAAPTIAAHTRPTARFVDFVTTFAADPPVDRPDPWAQVDWSKLKKIASKVYGYRSAVLHAGHPMPGPMLEVPWQGDMAHPIERPLGLGSAHGSTTWAPSDLPINLNTFAVLTRQAVLGWWVDLARGVAASGRGDRT